VSGGRWLPPGVTSDSAVGGPTVERENMMTWIDGESFGGDALSSFERDPYEDDGGES